jgi:hypothetical protein
MVAAEGGETMVKTRKKEKKGRERIKKRREK